MLTTEEEAKTKQCQESIMPTLIMLSQALPGNGFGYGINHCIGSACMAWRWHWSINEVDGTHQHVTDAPDGKPFGYCGKAGKP